MSGSLPEFATPSRESNLVRSFRTHAAYLRAFRHLALAPSVRGINDDLGVLAARAADQVMTGTPGRNVNIAEVLACLNRAWGTELILATTTELAGDSEVIRLANSWGSVQAYYALYGAVQAVLVAEGHPRPENHEATRKLYVDLWVTRRLDLAPWTFALASPESRMSDRDGFLGGPGRPIDLTVHPWSSWTTRDCWDVAAQGLRGSRRYYLDERFDAARQRKRAERRKSWRQQEQARIAAGKPARKQPTSLEARPQLSAADKTATAQGLRPTTLMDHLYRLRIRANYEDALLFSDGPETDSAARLWARDLVALTSASLMVHEMRLVDLLGAATVSDAADDWLARNSSALSGAAGGLAVRRALLNRRALPRQDDVQRA